MGGMAISDTSAEAQEVLNRLYRQMPMAKRLGLVFDAYEAGKQLALAGLRQRYPAASEREIWRLWARGRLGDNLFTAAYGAEADD